MVFTLALRNVFRHKLRSAMTLGAVAFGVTGLVLSGGFIADIFVQLGEAIIHSQTGHIQVFKRDYMEKGTRAPERYLIAEPALLAQRIGAHREVDAVMSRLAFSGLLNNGRRDLAIVGEGVEPGKESRLGSLLSITAGRQLAGTDRSGMLVGQGVAQSLGLKPGDRTTLLVNAAEGALNTLDFEVVGIFQSFSKDFDARAVRVPLAAAQELLGTSGANVLVVALKRTEDTDLAMAALSTDLADSAYELRSWRKLSDFYDKAVRLYDRQFGVLQLIILLMVVLSVANAVNMSVFERLGEFGTMRALGNKATEIRKLILVESLIIGLAGGIIGVAIGVAAALAISAIGIPMPPPPNANLGYTALIRIVPNTLLSALGIGVGATVLASLWPARKVSRAPVVEALRRNV
jgi:putative ABC transport system permease protein